MAGRKFNIAPMWAAMKAEGLDLEPSVPLNQNVYLGCGQKEVFPDRVLLSEKTKAFSEIVFFKSFGETRRHRSGRPDAIERTCS